MVSVVSPNRGVRSRLSRVTVAICQVPASFRRKADSLFSSSSPQPDSRPASTATSNIFAVKRYLSIFLQLQFNDLVYAGSPAACRQAQVVDTCVEVFQV